MEPVLPSVRPTGGQVSGWTGGVEGEGEVGAKKVVALCAFFPRLALMMARIALHSLPLPLQPRPLPLGLAAKVRERPLAGAFLDRQASINM